jgi:TolA-binding protein
MKKKYVTSLILVCLMPFLTHCASQQDVQNLNYNVRSVNKKIDDMKVNTVDQMQQRQAMSSGQLDQLQADILQLRSKLDENAHMNRMLQEQNKELQLAVQNLSIQQEEKLTIRLAELDSRIVSQKQSLTAIQVARVQDAERRSKAAKKAADAAMKRAQLATLAKTSNLGGDAVHLRATSRKILFSTAPDSSKITVNPISTAAPVAVAVTKPVPAKKTTPVAAQPVDTYAEAMQSFRDGKYKEAFGLFEKNVLKRGSSKTAITSRYMMGECLFEQGEFDQAIIQYQQIISNFPGNPQAGKALLRQGEAFEQLSDNETARIIYKKIIASYGSSPEAITAKKRISSL